MSISNQISESIKRESKRVFAFLRSVLPSPEDAEDLLHDSILQVLESYTDLERVDSFSAWFSRIAKNKVIDFYRKKKPLNESGMKWTSGDDDTPVTLDEIIPDVVYQPEQMILRERIWSEIQAGLNELPTEQRDAFISNEFEGESFREMESRLHVPLNTLIARKRYAVLALRKRLLPLYNELSLNQD